MATQTPSTLIIVIEPLPLPPPPPHHSLYNEATFQILAISILGILTTAVLLLSFIFIIRGCRNGCRLSSITIRRRLSRPRSNAHVPSFSAIYSSTAPIQRGLDKPTIQALPTLKFRRAEQQSSFHKCAICLNEFQQDERIRLLPGCLHVFHVDCIDAWLHTNANCPLCRAEITSSSPAAVVHGDAVVIDVRDDEARVDAKSPSVCGDERKLRKLSSVGDESIDVRGKGERLSVQPVRRSLSMDSSSEQGIYVAVQEILRQNQHFRDLGSGEGASNGSGRSRDHPSSSC